MGDGYAGKIGFVDLTKREIREEPLDPDLARGFIRAECFTYDDLMTCGSEKAVRTQGLLRVEGRDYIVQDGNILNIRFNV